MLKSIVVPEDILQEMIEKNWLTQRGEYIWQLNQVGCNNLRRALEWA